MGIIKSKHIPDSLLTIVSDCDEWGIIKGSGQSRQQCVKSRDNESLGTTGAPRADGINQKSAAELGPFGVKKIVFNLGLVKLERMHIS